ncbi:hypothetical protein Glove_132g137 [Diversispora epigaea]|uniref:Serine-threonine/tyrosine-protein kinase catalytic domain-containing protein n=1 Tax=Diversispora epigaea TaxID=1348612 RepID=A0A397J7I9_9GLOM|nr:hypothetical protein Glove_132g137 [Diversispora epigaea]
MFKKLDAFRLFTPYNYSNDNQDIQLENYYNNQSQATMGVFRRDTISISSFTTSNWREKRDLQCDINEWKEKNGFKIYGCSTTELLVNELEQYSRACLHDNMIGFYGILQKDLKSNKYLLVLEYANGGTLYDHLKYNFEKLEWSNKLNLAQQIVKAHMG